jgi:CRISPR system Cascade subunit CasD
VFLAGVSGDERLIEALDGALRNPAFPLYLGRRAYAPVGPLTLGVRAEELWENLHAEPWHASTWWKKKQASRIGLELRIDADAVPTDANVHSVSESQDMPISFNPIFRDYGWRAIVHAQVFLENEFAKPNDGRHDPMAVLGGA